MTATSTTLRNHCTQPPSPTRWVTSLRAVENFMDTPHFHCVRDGILGSRDNTIAEYTVEIASDRCTTAWRRPNLPRCSRVKTT